MTKNELRRLMKIEKRIQEIITNDLGLDYCPIEFDIVPAQKMLELMAYNIPTNISNWKRGRDYERQRTIYENAAGGLPYEVVINADPAKAYLMRDNKFAVQCLVMAHVYGHVAFFTMNKYFRKSRKDIVGIMYEASKRFLKYEHRFGIDEVEKTVDAGHALQLHSSPFVSNETNNEKRRRIFEQEKKKIHARGGLFNDITGTKGIEINEDIELFNQKLWRSLKLKTPVEPTDDLLGYIIDNSVVLEDWQRDILEVLRMEGQYYWPIIKTKYMNEGFATYIHEKVMNVLFKEGLLKAAEHADYNYSNSLVKATNLSGLNPYLVGSGMWKDIEERWDKGMHGEEWENCINFKEKEEWDTKESKGWDECKYVMETYMDWFFIQDFLTPELIKELKIYVFEAKDQGKYIDYVITKDTAKEIKDKLVRAFAHTTIPKIEIVNGNYNDSGCLAILHKWDGVDLDKTFATETMKHLLCIWGRKVILSTKEGKHTDITWSVSAKGESGETKKIEESKDNRWWDDYWKKLSHVSPLEIPYLLPF